MVVYKNTAVVTVKNSSSRLPNKAIMKIKGEIRSIDIVIERAKKTDLPVIICTSTTHIDDVFVDVAKQHNVAIFRGSLLNKIKRWNDCFNKFGIENALLIDGDDLSLNYDIGKRSMRELKAIQVDMVTNPSDIVTGFFTFAANKSAISKMIKIVPYEETNTDVITRYIEKANLKIGYVSLEDYERNENIRLTLDYEEDLEFFRKLYSNIDILASGKEIINYLNKNPKLLQINFHRQKDYLENQAKFNEAVK